MNKIILALSLCLATPAFADKVIGISDGDTLTLLVDNKPLKIRLAGIDAPERWQAYGERARQELSALCLGKDAQYKVQDVDRYGNTVAIVTCEGVEANRDQVITGMAWVYHRYNMDMSLLALEHEAREMRRGLWAEENPTPPWEFRARNKD